MAMWSDKTRITYTGTALPGNAEVVVLFSSTVAFGARSATHYRCYHFDVSVQASQAGTLQLQSSSDGGTTFALVGVTVAVAATAVGAEPVLFYVAPYQDWRVVWTNGATPQTTFAVDMMIDHESRGSVAVSVTVPG